METTAKPPQIDISELTSPPAQKATFNRAVDDALAACTAISNQRGGEYSDSWALGNQSTHFIDATLKLIHRIESSIDRSFSPAAKRLIMLASLCDVKISRLQGGWKRDTFDDLLNYIAAFTTLSAEYQGDLLK